MTKTKKHARARMKRPNILKCRCSLRIRLLGDGCRHCNPEFWRELAEEAGRDVVEKVIRELPSRPRRAKGAKP